MLKNLDHKDADIRIETIYALAKFSELGEFYLTTGTIWLLSFFRGVPQADTNGTDNF